MCLISAYKFCFISRQTKKLMYKKSYSLHFVVKSDARKRSTLLIYIAYLVWSCVAWLKDNRSLYALQAPWSESKTIKACKWLLLLYEYFFNIWYFNKKKKSLSYPYLPPATCQVPEGVCNCLFLSHIRHILLVTAAVVFPLLLHNL